MLDNLSDEREMLVLTFWEAKQAMDAFYTPNNTALNDFMQSTKQYIEQMPQRSDYEVVKLKI